MYSIEMLPAQQGDALWIEYGPAGKPHRILVDGGTAPTFSGIRSRVLGLEETDRHFELLIVTHIDTDHIGGILRLLADPSLGITFDDVWFNAWPQLQDLGQEHILGPTDAPDVDQLLGPFDGEILNRLLELHGTALGKGWNRAFGTAPGTRVALSESGDPPTATLAGGMKLTVLGPSLARLGKLRDAWEPVIRDTQLTDAERKALVDKNAKKKGIDLTLGAQIDVAAAAASPFRGDTTPANGSSIIVLAEFDGRSALLTGDAYAAEITKGIRRLLGSRTPKRDRLTVDVVKLPHHGSKKNVSLPMLRTLDCQRFLVSTNGAIFNHPDVDAIARVLVTNGPGVELGFAYDEPTTAVWNDPTMQADPSFGYTARYPNVAGIGLRTIV